MQSEIFRRRCEPRAKIDNEVAVGRDFIRSPAAERPIIPTQSARHWQAVQTIAVQSVRHFRSWGALMDKPQTVMQNRCRSASLSFEINIATMD
jgi:hypothetical protein